jgi:hypothetical protein
VAVDLTLISVPHTPEWWERSQILCGALRGPDDIVHRFSDGTEYVVTGERSTRVRDTFWNDLWIRGAGIRTLDLGPISVLGTWYGDVILGPPVRRLWEYLSVARVLTPGAASHVSVFFNAPDRSHFDYWRRPAPGRPYRPQRSWASRSWCPGRRRRVLAGWLRAQEGRIVWAECW